MERRSDRLDTNGGTAQIARRLERVRTEMRAAAETDVYDYRIVNEQRERAAGEIRAVIAAERLRLTRVPKPALE